MRLSLISFTRHGAMVCQTLFYGFLKGGHDCRAWGMAKYAAAYGLTPLEEPLARWCEKGFAEADALVFVGACGIAVRGIAPFVKDKRTDPAVVVTDEQGNYVISLLSGHIGGANELAVKVAEMTGGVPVVTTATDVNGLFAVDVFARQNGMVIENMKYAKAVSAALLDGEPVGFASRFPVRGEIPPQLLAEGDGGSDPKRPEKPAEAEEEQAMSGRNQAGGRPGTRPRLGIAVTLDETDQPDPDTLRLYPRIVTAGIGCRRDTPAELIEEKVLEALALHHMPVCCLAGAASIDLKAREEGILAFCRKYGLPYRVYTAQQLQAVPGDFSPSSFVSSVTGVDNVCERAAVLASGGGRLLQKKYAGDGVTVALAVKDWSADFE